MHKKFLRHTVLFQCTRYLLLGAVLLGAEGGELLAVPPGKFTLAVDKDAWEVGARIGAASLVIEEKDENGTSFRAVMTFPKTSFTESGHGVNVDLQNTNLVKQLEMVGNSAKVMKPRAGATVNLTVSVEDNYNNVLAKCENISVSGAPRLSEDDLQKSVSDLVGRLLPFAVVVDGNANRSFPTVQ